MRMSHMTDEASHRDEIATEVIPLPLCDDEDEPAASAQEPSRLVPSNGDVEGHGSWAVGDTA